MNYNKIRATWWSGTCYHFEQLSMIIANTDVKNYAYILHDKDKQDNSDELKKPHYHFLIQLQQKQRGSWFKQFAIDDLGIVFAEPCFAPQGAFNYLIHDTPHARKQGKYLYNESERISTITSLECDESIDENMELYADIMELVEGKITWQEMVHKKPKRIHMISNIKNTYAMFFFEKYGRQFFDTQRPPFKKHETTQLPQSQKYKIEQSTGEMIPITDPDELAKLPF